ncbi:hypothetical protein KIW84_044437 [Lathyrus oleraceus]|uniref:MMS19 nucleotide excision repair protein n=1 Tax=Pisum sativum TaxID=3888 RepID=A0A9D4XK75_PEA|nr:hypothetical protein KIW84_044437 [Pisum sativum]
MPFLHHLYLVNHQPILSLAQHLILTHFHQKASTFSSGFGTSALTFSSSAFGSSTSTAHHSLGFSAFVITSNRNKGDELVIIVMAYGRKTGIVTAKTIYAVSQGGEKGYVGSKIFSTEGVDSLQEEARQVANKSPGNQQGAVGESNVQINCSDSDQGGLIELEKLLQQKTFTRPEIDHLTALMLSRTLMHAFSSTPVFEPFVIPLFLEKLSSSLHSAKIDSLQYLRACSVKYGSERIAKYAKAIWSSLKDTINTYLDEPDLSFSLEPIDGIDFPKNEVVIKVLSLLQELIVQNSSQLISLIIDDEDVNFIINNISSYENYNTISVQEKKKLHAIGRILYLTAKTSIPSCNAVFQSLLSRMMDNLGFSASNTDGLQNGGSFASQSVNFGFLYLCIELLAGCRELVTLSEEKYGTYCTILHSFSAVLFNAFGSVLAVSDDRCPPDLDIYIGVKGLLILAMFHLDVFPIPKSTFENILKKLMSIIVEDFDKTVLWNATLKSIISYWLVCSKLHHCGYVSYSMPDNGYGSMSSYATKMHEGHGFPPLSTSEMTSPVRHRLESPDRLCVTDKTVASVERSEAPSYSHRSPPSSVKVPVRSSPVITSLIKLSLSAWLVSVCGR